MCVQWKKVVGPLLLCCLSAIKCALVGSYVQSLFVYVLLAQIFLSVCLWNVLFFVAYLSLFGLLSSNVTYTFGIFMTRWSEISYFILLSTFFSILSLEQSALRLSPICYLLLLLLFIHLHFIIAFIYIYAYNRST